MYINILKVFKKIVILFSFLALRQCTRSKLHEFVKTSLKHIE